jgi:aldehyde:ferredoxin oxidoreductase
MANDFGVCTLDTIFLLLWMDNCAAQGFLDKAATGLDLSKMGSCEFLEAFFQKIRSREGFGRIMADGLRRTAMAVGGKAEKAADDMLTASGRAIAYGPKVFSMAAPIYATEPRPFITELHEIFEPLTKWALWHMSGGEKTKVSTDVLRRIAAAFWGSEEAVDFSTVQGKALAALKIQNRQYVKESLDLCDFAWPIYDSAAGPDHVGDPTMEGRLYGAVTGRQIDTAGLDLIADRLLTLNRAILIREGRRGRKDDRLPEFMFIERQDMIADAFGMHNPELFLPGRGDEILSRKGKALDRQDFEQIMDEYYRLRGWDVQTGIPTVETLARLSLPEVSAVVSK